MASRLRAESSILRRRGRLQSTGRACGIRAQPRLRGFMRNLNDRVGWAMGMGSIFRS